MSEILRLQEYEYAEIVVECTISKLISKCGGNEPGPKVKTKFRPRTNKGLRQVHPNALIQAIYSIRGKYNIPIHFAENRKAAEEWVLGTLKKYYKGKRG
ncbi:MAG TPA: hypothetical protein ENH65_02430 [Candidatus Aminicenantes bacterium]|nr:hypothetical protein [Candidatus Aminicenantes bacterium]